MAPNPQCAALIAAKEKSGKSWAQVAQELGKSEEQVTKIVNGDARPTEAEFNSLAKVLGIQNQVPHTGVHATA